MRVFAVLRTLAELMGFSGTRLSLGDVDNSLGKSLGRFLRQVVPDAVLDQPVFILAGELVGIGAGLQARRAIGISLHRDGRHGDNREFGKALFQGVKLRPPYARTQPPTVIVNRDGNMIWIIEGGRAAIERGIIELHFGDAVCQMSLANSRRYFS